nr:PREDICTED: uncharacterized protein LOC103556457 [Equus przewalskii]
MFRPGSTEVAAGGPPLPRGGLRPGPFSSGFSSGLSGQWRGTGHWEDRRSPRPRGATVSAPPNARATPRRPAAAGARGRAAPEQSGKARGPRVRVPWRRAPARKACAGEGNRHNARPGLPAPVPASSANPLPHSDFLLLDSRSVSRGRLAALQRPFRFIIRQICCILEFPGLIGRGCLAGDSSPPGWTPRARPWLPRSAEPSPAAPTATPGFASHPRASTGLPFLGLACREGPG